MEELVKRVAKMLETAERDPDYKVKWARVNRAAGMLAGACATQHPEMEAAVAAAQECLARVAQTAHLPVLSVRMMVEGLGTRVVRGLAEWYGNGVSAA